MVFDYWSARAGDISVDFSVIVSIRDYERESIEQRVLPGLFQRAHAGATFIAFTGSRLFGNLQADGTWKVVGKA